MGDVACLVNFKLWVEWVAILIIPWFSLNGCQWFCLVHSSFYLLFWKRSRLLGKCDNDKNYKVNRTYMNSLAINKSTSSFHTHFDRIAGNPWFSSVIPLLFSYVHKYRCCCQRMLLSIHIAIPTVSWNRLTMLRSAFNTSITTTSLKLPTSHTSLYPTWKPLALHLPQQRQQRETVRFAQPQPVDRNQLLLHVEGK